MTLHPRIAVSSPHMSTARFEALLPRVAEHFAIWEVFGEGEQYLWDIETAFSELTPSYDMTFTAHAPISDMNVASFHPEVRALALRFLTQTIEAAGRMGIGRVTMHPGLRMPMARWDDDKLRRLTIEAARTLAATAEDVGVELCLENMAKNWVMTFQDPDWFDGVFGDTEGLRFCFDIAHAHTNGDSVTDAYVRRFAAACGNVHVSDNHGELDSHLVLGEGTVPLARTVAAMEAAGYRGNYVIEANRFEEGVASLPVMQAALADAQD